MFDIVRNNKRIVQIFLALITLPFAFWGVESYVRNVDSGKDVATVGDAKISQQELEVAQREQQDRMRNQLGGKFDPALFESPELKRAVLENLITQKLLATEARRAHITVGNEQLAQFIASQPSLQENGRFSKERYEALVANQGMSKEMFEARVRQDLAMQQLSLAAEAGIAGQAAAGRWLATQLEQREISEAALLPDAYVGQVKLADDAVDKYYEANHKQFELPEQVRAEFVVLSADMMAKEVPVTPESVRAAYDAANKGYDEAKQKAAALLAEVKKNPASFETLAGQHSLDPGSKGKGGDLGYFGRGAMVKPFEEAAYRMKVGEISGLVESDFGFHIIQLVDVRKGGSGEERRARHILLSKPAGGKSFDAAKAEIEANLRRQGTSKKFSEAAEAFTNIVYEQSDSLKPAAEKWKLELRQTGWMAKGGVLPPPFDNPKLAGALFSDDFLKNKRNTEAIQASSGNLVSARLLDYKPATVQPLEAVRAEVRNRLVREEAAKLAIKDGEAKLARLQKAEKVELKWSPARQLRRSDAVGLAPESARAVFAANPSKLPAYVGTPHPGLGYAIYRISGVKAAAKPEEDPRASALRQQYASAIAEEEAAAWLANLRQRHPVKINTAVLEAK